MSYFHADDHDYPRDGTIRLRSGLYMDLLNPTTQMIRLSDIAHALSNVCRFGGHVARFYSVAEHSMNVANLLRRQFGDRDLTAAGLLHDATEAYLGDMVRPLKRQMPEYKTAEQRMATVIGRAFGLLTGWDTDPRVKAADEQMLVWEMATVRDAEWRTPTDPAVVSAAFMRFAADLNLWPGDR